MPNLSRKTAPAAPAPHGCDFINRNIRLDARRTSIRLERILWEACDDILAREQVTLHHLCALIAERRDGGNMTAGLRLFITNYFRAAAMSAGFQQNPEDKGPLLAAALRALE